MSEIMKYQIGDLVMCPITHNIGIITSVRDSYFRITYKIYWQKENKNTFKTISWDHYEITPLVINFDDKV